MDLQFKFKLLQASKRFDQNPNLSYKLSTLGFSNDDDQNTYDDVNGDYLFKVYP